MSTEKTSTNPIRPDDEALDDWQQMMRGVAATPVEPTNPPASALPVEASPAYEDEDEDAEDLENETELACGLCYRPFSAEELTIASKERFNWEASVVACPECITELKLEMRAKSSGADLLLGLVWAVVGFVVLAGLISVAVYSIRADPNYGLWTWLGCYFAFVPGFIIGRMVRYGVGKRHSLEQQLIAMFFTLATAVVTAYAGWIAYNANFNDVLARTTNSASINILPFPRFVTGQLLPGLFNFTDLGALPVHLGTDIGIILGLVVAYFSSEGARVYTRPYAKTIRQSVS